MEAGHEHTESEPAAGPPVTGPIAAPAAAGLVGPNAPAAARFTALARGPAGARAGVVQALQRHAGNASVARAIAGAQGLARQQKPDGEAGATALDAASAQSLAAQGISLTPEDEAALHQGFPQGFTVGQAQPMVVGVLFGQRIDAYRLDGFKVTTRAQPVTPGTEAYLFQVGKGRAILLSSIGGGSVMLVAGTGQTTSVSEPSVQRLVGAVGAVIASGVEAPQRIKISHADTDHYNAVRALLQDAGFSNTAVEVAVQQMGRGSGGAWTASSLTVQPTQRLITINVTGGAVHVNRSVIDNMELIEFRSVQAAQDLADPNRTTFNRNRSSPVVVVHDLVSGHRMLFTADAEGRQFDEIVNAVGDNAMRVLLGASGRNLKLMEAPHHYGKQAGPDATGLINMLQLAYESGEGSLRLVAQTTQQFATNETRAMRSFNFLDSAGTAPERIEGDPSGAGQSEVTRARGSELERITLDTAGVQQALQVLQAQDTTLRQAYGKLAELSQLKEAAESMRLAFEASNAPPKLLASAQATQTEIEALETQLRTPANAVWNEMRTAAAGARGLSGSANMAPVTQALGQLQGRVAATEPDVAKARNALVTHMNGLSLYGRLFMNAARMVNALEAQNVELLYGLRAEHTDLVRASAASLGPAEVQAHVRAAWEATRADFPPARMEAITRDLSARVVNRQMSAAFRARLAESLGRQAQLNELAANAAHGIPSGPGAAPVSPGQVRAAGVMLAIELLRIGLELATQIDAGIKGAEADAARSKHEGVSAINWWEVRGIAPKLALVERSWWTGTKTLPFTDQGLIRQAATSDERPAGVPEFDLVAVTGVADGGLRKLITLLIAQLATLGDWNAFVETYPPGTVIKRFGNDWGVLVWDGEEASYQYHLADNVEAGISAELNRLHTALEAGQQARLDADLATAGPGHTQSVKDTAIFGADREVLVYSSRGGLHVVDFDDQQPRFIRKATVEYPIRGRGPLELVKAADLATFQKLSTHFWVHHTGREYMDESGTHEYLSVTVNTDGLAYVEPGQLQPISDDPNAKAGNREPAPAP